jgi:hypothetical protein
LISLGLIFEGFDLMDGSGLLFGEYECMGEPVCGMPYEALSAIFWEGLYLFIAGVSILVVCSILFLRMKGRTRKSLSSKIFSRSEKRVFASLFIVVLVVMIFFLLPIFPFQKTYSVQPANTFPRMDVCYQSSSVVNSPIYEYQGFASLGYLLFNQGNFVYSNCLVVSG